MRITGGEFLGRRLAPIRGYTIRPTPEHIREAIFSILGQDLSGTHVLDLFAGSGVLSLESLSRGSARAVMVDSSARALALMRKNVDLLGVRDRVRLVRHDLRRGLGPVRRPEALFDLVFLDPPYASGLTRATLELLDRSRILKPSAVVVSEHPREDAHHEEFHRLRRLEERSYGQTFVSLFRNLDSGSAAQVP